MPRIVCISRAAWEQSLYRDYRSTRVCSCERCGRASHTPRLLPKRGLVDRPGRDLPWHHPQWCKNASDYRNLVAGQASRRDERAERREPKASGMSAQTRHLVRVSMIFCRQCYAICNTGALTHVCSVRIPQNATSSASDMSGPDIVNMRFSTANRRYEAAL